MIIIDVETTGVNPQKHSIIEIAAMDFNNPQNTFHANVRAGDSREIDEFALSYNGNTKEEILDTDRPHIKRALEELLQWMQKIEDQTIAGHNPQFDVNFINEALVQNGFEEQLGRRMLDQHSLMYAYCLKHNIEIEMKNNVSNLHSDTIMKLVGIPTEPKPHKAMGGVKHEAEVFSRIIHDKNLLEEFTQYPINK